jgi:4-amino-4-deoxy-L-arabinose transferase-like glycosyltransferase
VRCKIPPILLFPACAFFRGRMQRERITDPETRLSDLSSANKPEMFIHSEPHSKLQSRLLSPGGARLALAALTVICLLPFIGKPFNVDDPLFVWAAKQIAQHPLDPYGFRVIWYDTEMPMSQITKNPPLASYYAALFGPWAGWREIALHLAFLLPALTVILATYELARGLTKRPLLAAVLTLAAPGFLVSATSVMCDVPMLALWMLCLLAWRRGLDSENRWYLLIGGALVALCALTKYFGACLLPLLVVYSLVRRKRVELWGPFLVLPAVVLLGYQLWTKHLYGQGLLWDATQYSLTTSSLLSPSKIGTFLVALSFTGGCALPVLAMAAVCIRKRWIAGAVVLAIVPAFLLAWNVVGKFSHQEHQASLVVTLIAFIAGGILTIFLAASDWQNAADSQKERLADSVLLAAWVLGTFVFAAFLNWTVNARSVLPLIPAVAILIARAIDRREVDCREIDRRRIALSARVLAPLVSVSLAISLWVAASDAAWAYSCRQAARAIVERHTAAQGHLLFTGHWGFQYYMQELGAQAVDVRKYNISPGDTVVRPGNNSNTKRVAPELVASTDSVELNLNYGVMVLNVHADAGFYTSLAGPLPFAFVRTSPEQYTIYHLKP